jgi:hypothetical protein
LAQAHGERREKFSPFNLAPADIAAAAMKSFEEFAEAQAKQFDNFQERNRQWLIRVEAETNLASEFVPKLTAARSIPDAMTVYKEWGDKRLEMMAEDTKHIIENAQKFMQASAQLLANGWQTKGRPISS